jgi:hypothetical protein
MNDKRQIVGRTFDAGVERFIDDTAKGKSLEALRALFGCNSDITATDITATATLQPPRAAQSALLRRPRWAEEDNNTPDKE